MALILNIETATELCSVALSKDGNIISIRESTTEKSHAGNLTVFIEEIIKEQGISIPDLNAVAVGKGPGSYTGLRIGVSVAKGLCYGAGIPLIAVGTLQIMIACVKQQKLLEDDTLLCPMIDARRMEVYCCISDHQGSEIVPVSAQIIEKDTFRNYLDMNKVAFFGSGMEKCRELLDHLNAIFIPGIMPHSSALAQLSHAYYVAQRFENTAYFEPFYLKDFVTTVPKRGLNF